MNIFKRHQRNAQQEVVDKLVQPVKSTATLVKELGYQLTDTHIQRLEHLKKLRQVTGSYSRALSAEALQKYVDAGFRWFVGADFVRQFRYHAEVFSASAWNFLSVVEQIEKGRFSGRRVIYVGDIPDFALDNLLKVKELGLACATIHSMQPMPVELVLTDPVVIGWMTNPHITVSPDIVSFLFPDATGIVLAMWDGEKEIEVL